MWKWLLTGMLAASAVGLFGGGCSSKLESGYEPRKLSASPAERRGFYADAFSPEARAAQEERADEFDARRPRY